MDYTKLEVIIYYSSGALIKISDNKEYWADGKEKERKLLRKIAARNNNIDKTIKNRYGNYGKRMLLIDEKIKPHSLIKDTQQERKHYYPHPTKTQEIFSII